MPTKAQIQSVGKALRKSVDRWNKAKFKLKKVQQAYDKAKARMDAYHYPKGAIRARFGKAKIEFDRAQTNYEKIQKHFKEVMGRG